MRRFVRASLASAALFVTALTGLASAQPYYVPDDEPPPPRRRAVGYNCEAIQRGFTGPHPYSCPLAGPRPLGMRCFCDLPIAPFSPPQPPAPGRVVP